MSKEPIKPLRFGLVGLRFGRYHARTLTGLPGIELAAVADRDATPADIASMAIPSGVAIFNDAQRMMDEAQLDAVVLAVSPKFREGLLQLCVERNLPCFVEKPWAGNPAQARKLAALAAPLEDRIMSGFSFRFHPVVRKLKALLEGELGAPWMGNGDYAFNWNLGPEGWLWEANGGGGVFNENSCHLFDIICHLFGRPSSVQATTHNPRGLPSAELGGVLLNFPSGAFVSMTLGGLGAAPFSDSPRLDLVTANGRACMTGRGHIWESLTWARRDASHLSRIEAPTEILGNTRYGEALVHFAQSIRAGKRPEATIQDGILAVDVADAVYRAAASGERIDIPSL